MGHFGKLIIFSSESELINEQVRNQRREMNESSWQGISEHHSFLLRLTSSCLTTVAHPLPRSDLCEVYQILKEWILPKVGGHVKLFIREYIVPNSA